MRNLRELNTRASRLEGLCDIVWQGDFGKGVPTGSGILNQAGVNPWTLAGPLSPTSSSNMVGAIPVLQMRVGTTVIGDYGTEWIFCRWVPGSTLDLLPGQVFSIDENFTASQLTTAVAAANKNGSVGVAVAFQPAVVAGTYYLWLCRAGQVAVQAAAASLAGGQAESGATAGVVKFLNTHTSATWSVSPLTAYGASSSVQFLGDTVNGQPFITNVASQVSINGVVGGITDLMIGQVITGTGMPANALIKTIESYQGKWRITIGTNTTGNQNTNQNATATNPAQTFTVTNMVPALVYWPVIGNVVTP